MNNLQKTIEDLKVLFPELKTDEKDFNKVAFANMTVNRFGHREIKKVEKIALENDTIIRFINKRVGRKAFVSYNIVNNSNAI